MIIDEGHIVDLGLQGEVFEDDGYVLEKELKAYLWSLNDKDDGREQGVYHPSQLSKCARKLYYERIGTQPRGNVPADLRLIFDTGHAVHDQLGKYIAGMFGVEEAVVEQRVEVEEFHIAGSADLVLYWPDGRARRVIDFKTSSSKSFSRLRPPKVNDKGDVSPVSMRGYVWQLHSYMVAVDCPQSSLFYYNKDNSSIMEFPVPFNVNLWMKIEDKLTGIEECVKDGTPPPREISKMECAGCKFHWKCKPPGIKAKHNK